jgi:hypothetical protein
VAAKDAGQSAGLLGDRVVAAPLEFILDLAPVNASPTPSRTPTHDSGPPWIASPSMSGSFLPSFMSVYPGALRTYVRARVRLHG